MITNRKAGKKINRIYKLPTLEMKLGISLLTTCTREYYKQLHPCKSDNMKETDQYHKPLKLDLGERYNMNSLITVKEI